MIRTSPITAARLVGIGLALLTLVVFWPVVTCDFINIDDWVYVTDNPNVKVGLTWSGIVWAFTGTLAGNWHPITNLSHMLDSQVFGVRSAGHHLTSLLLHAANSVLLFIVLRRMTRATWRSAFAAALFAIHPLRVESVAWVSERKDVLSGFFFMLTLWAYARYAMVDAQPSNGSEGTSRFRLQASRFYMVSLVFFILGLMAKSMLVTVPFVLLLLDYWPLARIGSRFCSGDQPKGRGPGGGTFSLLAEKLPFFLLTAAGSAVAFISQKGSGAVVALDAFPLHARLANAVVSWVRYLGKTFWPEGLAVFYPYENRWPAWQVLGAAGLLLAVSVAAVTLVRRKPYVFVGWLWFLGMLVPVIGLVQIGSQALADRYTYLPSIGVFVTLSWGLADPLAPRFGRRILASGAACLLLAYAAVTLAQLRHWRTSQALLEHTLRVTTHNARAHYCLAVILETQGKRDEAHAHYTAAIRDAPSFAEAHSGLGGILAGQQKLDEALAEFRAALRYTADFPQAHYGLADVFARQGHADEAIAQYNAALRANPDYAEAHYQLATLLSAKDPGGAIAHFREALRLKLDWLEALNNLAWLLASQADAKLRNGAEAVRMATRAVELTHTNNPAALDTLAAAYAEAGDFDRAVSTAQAAKRIAEAGVQTALATQIHARLELYQRRQPARE